MIGNARKASENIYTALKSLLFRYQIYLRTVNVKLSKRLRQFLRHLSIEGFLKD